MKILYINLLVATLVLNSSCRKDFKCTCSKIYKDRVGSNVRDYSVKTYRDSRSAAEEKCNASTDSGSDDTGNYSLNCQIEC